MRVRLSSNESPFGPSPQAVQAAQAVIADGHRYPDDQATAAREAFAGARGRTVEEVALGTGSTGLLMDAIAHAAAHGDEVLTFQHGFVVYRLAAANAGARVVEAPVGPPARDHTGGYVRDVDALLERVTPATRVVAVDNPGNPTGTHLDADQLRALCERVPEDVLVVVDEAYHHFAVGQSGYARADQLGIDRPRLVVVETFSKAYALAGMRIGGLTGPAELVAELDARRPRFNVSAPAQAAAIASLADTAHLEHTVQGTIEGRRRMAEGLASLGTAFTEGLGNFVTLEIGPHAEQVVDAYAREGIGVRGLAAFGMPGQVRVTVGTPPEVDAFLDASAEVLTDVAHGS